MRMGHENNFRDSQSTIVNELMPMYTKSGMKERPEIWVARGIFNIAAKVNEIVQNSQQELLVALPFVAENVAKPIQPILRMLHDKGVRIKILASAKINPETLKALSRVAEVRLKDGLFGGGVIGDGKHVVILLGEGTGENGSFEPIAIWADHAGLAGFAKGYFQYLWEDTSPKNEKKKAR
jgi:sugar-specific transcriptional regulator TrmB